MARVFKCKATSVIDFCISRGAVPTNWASLLESVELRKSELTKESEFIAASEPKSFVLANMGAMNYEKVKELLILFLSHENLSSKILRVMGLYQHPVLKGWMETAMIYEKHNLFLVEPAKQLKQLLHELAYLKKSMNDGLVQLVEIGEKFIANENAVEMKRNEVRKLEKLIGVVPDESDSEIFRKAQTYHSTQVVSSKERLKAFFDGEDFSKSVEEYNGKFGTSLQDSLEPLSSLRLVAEELAIYHSTLDPKSKQSLSFAKILAEIKDIISQDPNLKAEKTATEIKRLRKSCIDTKVLTKLQERESRLRQDLRTMDERATELRERKEGLITSVQSALKRVFPDLEIELVFSEN